MEHTSIANLALLLLLVTPLPAHSERTCPSATTPGTWTEALVSISGVVQGCLDEEGKRIGKVVVTDASGREILSGMYKNGLRQGPWAVQIFAEGPDGLTSERMEFWLDEGVNRAIEGGRLSRLVSARDEATSTSPARQGDLDAHPRIKTVAMERLALQWCETCPSFAAEIHSDGRVEYIGYSGVKRLGPHCGSLSSVYVGPILRLAEQADLPELENSYQRPVSHPSRLIVLAKGDSFEKLVSIEGTGEPVELFDLSHVIELAMLAVDWECPAP